MATVPASSNSPASPIQRELPSPQAITGLYDPVLVCTSMVLAGLGVVMVGSSSIAIGENLEVGPFYYLIRHCVYLFLGVVLAGLIMRTELKDIEKHNQYLLLACFLLLLAVFLPFLGSTVNGARRWLNLGVAKFQAVEAVKLMFIVWLASYLVRFSSDVSATWGAMLKPLAIVTALMGLLLKQPDFGSAALLLSVTAGMLVLGGVNLPRMSLPIVAGLPVLAFIAILEPYRVRRLVSFLSPWEDQQGSGYQLTNALMAVGRGEFFGVGLGSSVQKLSYLPEAHTDFIFSIVAEELGFLGVLLVIGLYVLLVGRAFWIGIRCIEMRRHFSGFCAFGLGLLIALQSLVSIGVNLGILPTKGLTLPLVSSGGSSILMTCAGIGLLLRVSYELKRAERQVALRRNEEGRPLPPLDTPTAATLSPVSPMPISPTPLSPSANLRGNSL